ncbi:MAG: hypothetical protein PWQ06_1170 [Anaerophaga sp.]|nr:hypothetical protein [Anaerophaga sp.]
MIQLLKEFPGIIVFALLQFLAISLTGNGALFIVPALAFWSYMTSGKLFYPFIALMILLPLADSDFAFSTVAANTRPVLMVVLTLLVLFNNYIHPKKYWSLNAFIPYFLVVSYYLLDVSDFSQISRYISYMLVIAFTPVLIDHMIKYEKEAFLRGIVLIYTMVYILSFLNIESDASLHEYGRFSGIFHNPNALGIFSFLFFMLVQVVFYYQPQLFSRGERYMVVFLILAGVIYSRSRSGMFAIALFWSSVYFYKRWGFSGIIFLILLGAISSSVFSFENIIRTLGLAEFFRLESLETGSGRLIAFKEAWGQIKQNPVNGYGIGYTGQYFSEHSERLAREGHVGSVHNSFLWVWLDTGLFGLISYIYAWGSWFFKTYKYSLLTVPIGIAVLFSANLENWLMGSLNHVTIQLIIILVLLSSPSFLNKNEEPLEE